ncbi:MAG: hypothetical protein ACXVW7_12450 [Trebonia sp.]
MVGASPGDGLRQLTTQAAGNPLYVRELVDALLREDALRISTVAGVSPSWERLPVSLAAILDDRLTSVSADTAQLLRTAALLGGRFAVTDLAVVVRRTVSDAAANMQEAVAADIAADAGPEAAIPQPGHQLPVLRRLRACGCHLTGHRSSAWAHPGRFRRRARRATARSGR